MQRSDVTIVVLNWNRADETIECIASLRAADLGGAKVLVVDNGSRDGSVETLRQRFPDLQIIALPENRGYAGGNNVGIRAALEAGAQGVMLLNNDTRVSPDFLEPLLWTMGNADCAAVSTAVLRMDRPDMHDVVCVMVDFRHRYPVQLVGVRAPVLDTEGRFNQECEIPIAAGCAVLIRAEVLRSIGLLDEAYFAYHEDVDWCLRARKAGWKIYYQPYARVFHRGSASTRRTDDGDLREDEAQLPTAERASSSPARSYLGARNTVRLLKAHASAGDRRVWRRETVRRLFLESTAIVCGRLGWFTLGRWTRRDMLRLYVLEAHHIPSTAPGSPGGRIGRALRIAAWLPVDLFWRFPRDAFRAWRRGELDDLVETTRGYVDGYLDAWIRRPLPLARLGLR